jgi:outer membrane immunogenic protein
LGINTLDSSGGLYGVQAGCNYQFAGNWVVGVQGDIAGANISGNAPDPLNGSGNPPQTGFSIGMKTDRLASVTGRLGVTAWNNQALFYVKGGAAWDKNQWNFRQTFNCINSNCPNPFADDRRTGWTVGGGVEWGSRRAGRTGRRLPSTTTMASAMDLTSRNSIRGTSSRLNRISRPSRSD